MNILYFKIIDDFGVVKISVGCIMFFGVGNGINELNE